MDVCPTAFADVILAGHAIVQSHCLDRMADDGMGANLFAPIGKVKLLPQHSTPSDGVTK